MPILLPPPKDPRPEPKGNQPRSLPFRGGREIRVPAMTSGDLESNPLQSDSHRPTGGRE